MRLRIASDLHLDCCQAPPLTPCGFDAAVVAGDVMNLGSSSPSKFLDKLESLFPEERIFFVPGNHEGYGATDWHMMLERLCKAASGRRVKVLARSFEDWNGVRFIGATLWTNFRLFGLSKEAAATVATVRCLRDYDLIHSCGRPIRGEDSLKWHREDLAYIESKLAEDFDGKVVVVSHHAPTEMSLAPRYARDLVSAGFVSRLPEDVVGACDLWVHGHTHTSFDYEYGGARVICNPRGYTSDPMVSTENPDFRFDYGVEI